MPLIKSVLKNEIIKITDVSNPIHEGYPTNISLASKRWAAAIDKYASQVIPVSITTQLAKTKLAESLLAIEIIGTPAFITALTEYSIDLSVGMSPLFTGTPPPIPIVLAPIFALGFKGASAETIAELLSSTIDTWFKTGTAINISTSIITNWE